MKKLYIPLAIALAAFDSSVQATTVIPPSFDELVDKAEVIFEGNVTEVKSQWVGEGAERHIVSYVTFAVKDSLKGESGAKYTLRMFGGEVDGEGMAIADAPKFKVGDEEILFVENNGSQLVPLVGIMHGRFHVRKEAGREVMTTDAEEKETTVKSTARIGQANEDSTNEPALSAADFKSAIKEKVEAKQRERDSNR